MTTQVGSFKAIKRRTLSLSQEALVRFGHLDAAGTLPLLAEPEVDGLNPATWGAAHRAHVETLVHRHGAVLFRGFRVGGVEGFEEFARAVTPELLDYKERAAPRKEVGRNIYTSTEFPADQRIPLHHEMSYSHNWPTKLWFYCAQPAEQGGATPVADDRKVFRLINPKIKEVFMSKKVMYVRNYGEGVDMTWQDAFQTEDRARVEEYCRRSHTIFEWKDGDRLRTRQVRQAVATHPALGETVWFNHAHMFHVSNLQPAVRESLLSEFRDDELPRNAFYGDGTHIDDSVLEEIRAVYNETAVTFTWQEGDVLLLDNFLTSHGREPYAGPRRVVVAMAELFTNQDI